MTNQPMPTPRNFNQPNQPAQQPAQPVQPGQHPGQPAPARKSSRIGWKIAIVIAAVLALIVPLGVLAVTMVASASYEHRTQNGAIPEDIDRLEINTNLAEVTVVDSAEIGDRDMPPESQVTGWFDARYRQHKDDSESASPVKVQKSGSTAVVDIKPQNKRGAEVTIGLPKDLAEKLAIDLNLSRGALYVDGKYKDIAASIRGGAVEVEGEAEKLAVDIKGGEADVDGVFDDASFKVQGGEVGAEHLDAKKKVSVNVTAGSADLQLGPNSQPADGVDLRVAAGSASLLVPDPKGMENARDYVIVDDGMANLGDTTISIEAKRVADMSEVGEDVPLRINAGAGDLEIGYWDAGGDYSDEDDLDE